MLQVTQASPANSPSDTRSTHFETRAQMVHLDAEGIIRASSKPNVDLDLESAQDCVQGLAAILGGVRRPILVDFTDTRSVSRDARKYFAGEETTRIESAAALLVGSPLARAIGNFFMGFNNPSIPTRLFTSEAEALEWLRGFLP